MSSHATGTPAGSVDLRARAIVDRTNCPLEQAMHLARGGTNAAWYASCASPPVETEESVRERVAERIVARCPPGLTEAQTHAWVTAALREAGAAPSLAEGVEAGAIRNEFVSFCDHVRDVLDHAEAMQ